MNAIIGATASGKSALAIELAREFGLSIFSLDSLCVYRYVDVAAAKPTKAELSAVKHYGIDALSPNEKCDAGVFLRLLNAAVAEMSGESGEGKNSPKNAKKRGESHESTESIESCGGVESGGESFRSESGESPAPSAPNESRESPESLALRPPLDSPNLLLVGGSGFYLKALIDGLSALPKADNITMKFCAKLAQNPAAHALLAKIDPAYAQKIHPRDKYRVAKGFEIFLLTRTSPSAFFAAHRRECCPFSVKIFEIVRQKPELDVRIAQRTAQMLENGLVEEVDFLRRNFPDSQILRAIGVKEIVAFLEGQASLESALAAITKNTIALAKRQRTFNRTQFRDVVRGSFEEIAAALRQSYQENHEKSHERRQAK